MPCILLLHNIHIKYLMIYNICRQYCIHLLQGHAPCRFNSLTCFIKEIVINTIWEALHDLCGCDSLTLVVMQKPHRVNGWLCTFVVNGCTIIIAAREALPTWDKQIQSLCFQVNQIIEKISQSAPEWMMKTTESQMTDGQ